MEDSGSSRWFIKGNKIRKVGKFTMWKGFSNFSRYFFKTNLVSTFISDVLS